MFSSLVQVSEAADGDTRPEVRDPHVVHQLRDNSQSVQPQDSSQ